MRAVFASASSFSMNASWMLSCSSRREPAMQVWPVAAKMPETAPFTASSRFASSNTMFGDLPAQLQAHALERLRRELVDQRDRSRPSR